MKIDYQQAWEFLDNLQFFKIKLGLASMKHFLEGLNNPHQKIRTVHIAGTNGKGSTASILFSILCQAGYRVGFYSSPHLSSVRERFRINDQIISQEDFCQHAAEIIDILGTKQITYFEFTTSLAFLYFVAQQVDVAIIEVGMGGRLDATNVIVPEVSIITNVSMDHEAYLGGTIPQVAREKAGIIKQGIPVISGAVDQEAMEVIRQVAEEKNAPLFLLGQHFSSICDKASGWEYRGVSGRTLPQLEMSLLGNHQKENGALALATLEILKTKGIDADDETTIRAGLNRVFWPGRIEKIYVPRNDLYNFFSIQQKNERLREEGLQVKFLLDGAHNPAGVASLSAYLLANNHRSLICIWASMEDKDIESCLLPIAKMCDQLILTRPESERSALPESLKNLLPIDLQNKTICCDTVQEAFRKALVTATKRDELICVAGSLYLIGKARELLLKAQGLGNKQEAMS